MPKSTPGFLCRYAFALLAVALAVVVRWWADPWLESRQPLATLYGAVAFAVWYGGFRPALLAVVVGYTACGYLFIESRGTIVPRNFEDLLGLGVYLLSCSIIIEFGKEALSVRRRLENRERDLDEFVATLVHELRNPLTPIQNALQILKSVELPDGILTWSRGVIDRQVKQLSRLIDGCIELSRIKHNKLTLCKMRVELASVIEIAVEASRLQIKACGHELTVAAPREPITIECDPIRLAEVFSSLLNNAAKLTQQHGHIRLSVERTNGTVEVSVSDDGIGIAQNALPHIFELFWQSASTANGSQGLGVGLALVRGIVELHGGSIEAHSRGLGKGSEFVVRMPVAAPQLATPRAASDNGSNTNGKTDGVGWRKTADLLRLPWQLLRDLRIRNCR